MSNRKPPFPYFKYAVKYPIIWVVAAFVVFVSIVVYSGNWPAFYVIESSSMAHCVDEAQLGVLDMGDMVIAKSIDDENEVVTYMKGKRTAYETYGSYGDVIFYRKNGYDDITPVIHRALLWVEFNRTTQDSYDVPELKHHSNGWHVEGGPQHWYDITGTLVLEDIGIDHNDVRIGLGNILTNCFDAYDLTPHSGFITLGDLNRGRIDQGLLRDEHDIDGQPVGPTGGLPLRPIQSRWIIGMARGELPGLGIVKLSSEDPDVNDRAPENIWSMFYFTIGIMIAVFILVPICLFFLEVSIRKKKMKKKIEEDKEEVEVIRARGPEKSLSAEEKPPPVN
ncbi:MAG: S26 family signal peptidase [Thermoplasmata archaeon]|nr:MAG: S26 family signal peptidase [Thermoplasmata archaeon]